MGTEADWKKGGMRDSVRCPMWELKRAVGLDRDKGLHCMKVDRE